MQNTQIISTIKETLSYLYQRQETIFDEIQQLEQVNENLTTEIESKESEIKIQETKEYQESNIFNLYETSKPFAEEKKRLTEIVEKKHVEQDKTKSILSKKRQELEQINKTIIANQLILRHMEDESQPEQTERITLAKNESESPITDFTNRLKLIEQLLDLDSTRCKLELQKLIEESRQVQP